MATLASYTCPNCGRTSHNPRDAAERYCAACHIFEDETRVQGTLLAVPTTPGQHIGELHAWIATHADGSEGIIGASQPQPGGGTRVMPLVSSRRTTMEVRRDMAEQAMALSRGRGAAEVRRIALVTFRRVTDG